MKTIKTENKYSTFTRNVQLKIDEFFAERNKCWPLNMFFTGTFSIEDSFLNTTQKPHDDHHPYDDDVVSRITEDGISAMMNDMTAKDGFVSNVGDTVTIHIREKYLNTAVTVEIIKIKFGLSEERGVKSVSVVPFSG